MPGIQNFFWIFFKIPFPNRLKVFYLPTELPSDEENRNGFAVERFWFLVHVAGSEKRKNFVSSSEWLMDKVFTQAKYPAVGKPAGKLESLLLIKPKD